ncbi:MAG TPA: OmpH family outer membrane protein [Candidatus Xenobia bacterium]
MRKFYLFLAAVLLMLAPPPARADSPTALSIGIVDVNRIIQEQPEYQQYSQQYMDERKKLFDPGKAKTSAQFKNVLVQRRNEIQEAEEKWGKIKQQFIVDITTRIQKASDQVMKDKKLDFVLMDAPWYPGAPLHQSGAVDITTDVLLALKNQK